MNDTELLAEIHRLFLSGVRDATPEVMAVLDPFLDALTEGRLRAAVRDERGEWRVQPEVKEGILLGFRVGRVVEMSQAGAILPFADKSTYPPQRPRFAERGIRIVPGGSSVRRGAYLGARVTCMPPMYVNAGAWIGDDTMVDSHALVGSCAQIGAGVHLSAAAQIGGVLEPVGMRPVIVEDRVLVGAHVSVLEGTLVRAGAVLGAGVQLTASTPVFDLVHERELRAGDGAPLEIPENAVVVPGSRPVRGSAWAVQRGLQLACAIIVKYRDDKTDLRAALEGDLR